MTFIDIASLSLKQKIGQLMFIGISGTELDANSAELIKDIAPGGVCLFARNIRSAEQVRKLTDDLRSAIEIMPFISLDQEGGLVDRLRRVVTPMPAAAEFTHRSDVEKFGTTVALVIKQLGFNMNFAPVVDINTPERAKFMNGLQSRAFGENTEQTIEMAAAFLKGLNENGIIGCLKHFPGLGASQVDSHNELPQINITKNELEATDLEPYKQLLSAGAGNPVMVAHAAYPNIDLQETDRNGRLLPSSLSGHFVDGLLRNDLNFTGLVITDDLEMGAIINNYGIGEACKMALKAGVDMLAICAGENSIREGFDAIHNAVEIGEISEERVDESLKRIFQSKMNISVLPELSIDRLNILSVGIEELKTHLKNLEGNTFA